MTQTRLDNVLSRNRSNLLRDLVLAAVLPLVVLFSGTAIAAQLPALSAAPQPVDSAHSDRIAAEIESNAVWQAALDQQDENQPFGV
jgi:hypothetical protein